MHCCQLPVVCLLVLYSVTVYVSGTRQRNVTYFQDDVCGLRLYGKMSNETLQKYGRRLTETTQEWISVNAGALAHWRGNRSWTDGCPVEGNNTEQLEKVEALPAMFFLEFISTLEQIEEEKIATLLFPTCAVQHSSLQLTSLIKSYLCYLLAGIESLTDATITDTFELNLSRDVVQRTDIADVMGMVVRWGECVAEGDGRDCIQDLGFFQGC